MRHNTSFLKAADGLTLFTQSWLPEETPRALVVIVHGYGEHSTRYAVTAAALAQAGVAVYALDHRGHGKSEGLRAWFESLKEPVADLRLFVESIQRTHAGLKLFVLGHSMGTLISLHYVLRYQHEVAGLMLSGTALTGDETVPGFFIPVGQFLGRFIPRVPLFPPLPLAEICSDPAIVTAYENDPLVYRGWWRIGMGIGLIVGGRDLQAQLPQLTLPLLILHGEADKITPISGAHLARDRAKSVDKTFKSFAGMRHEVLNEVGKGEVLDTIVHWLDKHV